MLSGRIAQVLVIGVLASTATGEPIEVPTVVVSGIEQVEVPARQRGPLMSVTVADGAPVEVGDVLALVDDRDAQLAKQRAELNLESAREEAANPLKIELARKSLQLAQSELDRGQRSRERFQDSISDEELHSRKLKVERGELEVNQAEHEQRIAQNKSRLSENELLAAERQLEQHRIVAPLAGIVVQVDRCGGEWVEPGQTVCRILRMNRLRAEGFLPANVLPVLQVGQPVRLVVGTGTERREFAGTLKFISPEINPVDGRVRMWAEIDNPALELRPGMRGSLTIEPAVSQP